MPNKRKRLNAEEAEECRRKWGIPDWRDEKAYPANLSDELWRWEFLRRREDYREDWKREYLKTVEWYRHHSFQEWMTNNLTAPGPIQPSNWDCEPESETFIVSMNDSIRKYRMPTLINPAVARPRNLGFWSVHLIEAGDYVFAPMALALDPIVSLEAHIEVLKMGLQMLQKQIGINTPKPHEEGWPDYLRVLDAVAVGEKNEEIWEILRPNVMAYFPVSRAGDLIRAAKKLQKKLIRPTK